MNILNSKDKLFIVFLVSGHGGNLKFVQEYIKLNKIEHFEILAVIADRECNAVEYAKKQKINTHIIAYSKQNPDNLCNMLSKYNPDIIISNWHKILDLNTVKSYKNKIINLHYSLLPAFSGMIGDKPIREAIKKNCKYVGTTVHYVNENVDDGEIIGQTIIRVEDYNNFTLIMNKIFQDGAINLMNSIFYIVGHINNRPFSNGSVSISPPLCFDISKINSIFWQYLGII